MAYKSRTEPQKLIISRILDKRMNLSEKDRQHYVSLQKGYEGEVMFDALTERLQGDCFIVNDLLLKFNNTLFQIDTLIIASDKIYLYEVKNFEGDYYLESDRLYKVPKYEYNNPLFQLTRSESLLRQLLQNLGCNLPIEAKVVFINPEFTLYKAPLDNPFIFPTQIKKYLNKVDSTFTKLAQWHKKLADQLISLHINENPYTLLPPYEYEQLKKGVICKVCGSFSFTIQGYYCHCGDCDQKELISAAILRSVREYRILFPDEKVSTNIIYDWCGGIKEKRTMRRILLKNFDRIGTKQWTYYE
ncbi:nuclease-related domain-containing protein [Bacillus sp. S/N-304-OC-R1]|uniref:nuclease-related domain-containing protein n=1 Tax=Bacillus sp. S/N-304-OC-R1 TaxID=2758034 RepID=UPI001C8E4A4E|nr:nuclease-related domain-containing protein [Bacillus sp. S/N-304-OC-R1]MBY0122792.1 NERD domain-containing protein [Bacillus sp. S/N-304-OC-R1]